MNAAAHFGCLGHDHATRRHAARLALFLAFVSPLAALASDPDAPSVEGPQTLLRASAGQPQGEATRIGERSEPTVRLEFRRVLVPHDRPTEWPTTGETYLPVPKERFEQLLKELADRPLASADLAASVRSATYSARLTDDAILQGDAKLNVEHRAPGTAVLQLGSCNLAMQNLRWADDAQAPIAGLSSSGETVVLVERSGQLRFDWLRRATTTDVDRWDFTLDLPSAAATQVSYLVPSSRTVAISAGLLTAGAEEGSAGRWWHAILGPRRRLDLTIRAARDQKAAASTRVRQAMRYDVTSRGIEVSADLEFESYRWPLDEFEFIADGGFELLEVRIGGEPAQGVAATMRDDGSATYLVRGRVPAASGRQLIQITGTARVEAAASRPLPALRPKGAVWQSGKTTLTIHAPLWLDSLDLTDCRQVALASLPPPAQGEAYDFEWFDPAARIVAGIVPARTGWQAAMGSRLDITDGEVVGRTTLHLQADAGETFLIEADVENSWLIDSVEAIPPEAMADWTFEPQVSADPELKVRLARALRPAEPLTLVVNGRRPRWNIDQAFRAAELAMLALPGDRHAPAIMRVRTTPPLRVELKNDPSLLRIDPGSLTPAQLELIGGEADGLLLAVGPDSGESPLSLLTGTPTLTAAIRVVASLGDSEIVERYELACTPQRTRLRRVWVRFSQPRAEAVEWSLENDRSAAVMARLISQDEQRGLGLPPGGEVWEVALPRPASVSFKLVGLRRSKVGVVAPVNLLSMPEADQQIGRVEVRSIDAWPMDILAPRLRGLALERPSSAQVPEIIAAYEYTPQLDADPTAAPAISLVRRSELAGRWPRAIVRDCQLQSKLAIDGTATHLASYELELSGLEQFKLRLPAEVEAIAVWIDGQRQSARTLSDSDLTIDLPIGTRRTRLAVEMRSREARSPGLWMRLTAPLPVPVDKEVRAIAPRWSIALPTGFAVVGNSLGWMFADRDGADWREHLFGGLARDAAMFAAPDLAGANIHELQAAAAESAVATLVTVADVTKLRVLGWSGFWLAVGLTWLLRPSGRASAGACGILAAVTLTLPAPYWLLASHLWMGVLAGKIASCWLPKSTRPAGSRSEPSGRALSLAGSARLLLVVLTIGAVVTAVRVVATAAEAVATEVPCVLIPSRDGDEPTGDPYMVPETLWREMRRSAAEVTGRPAGWLLTNGQYRIALDWARDGQRLRLAQAQASYDLHVFAAASRVALPFGDEQMRDSFHVRLDGQRVATVQNKNQGLEIVVPAPGIYRLEVQLDARAHSPELAELSWRVPALPCAQAQIELPPDAPPIEFDATTGTVKSRAGQQSITAALSGLTRLQVRWPNSARPTDLQSLPDIEQLTWVTLQPGAVVVQVRFRLPSPAGRQFIRVETADDLRPLPASDESRPVPSAERVGTSRQVLTVPLVSASDGTAVAELNLLAERASGIGQFAAPWIVPLQARVSQRWLAISVIGNLDVVETSTERYEAAPKSEFLTAWGDTTAPPLRTYLQRGPDESNWLISGRPRAMQKLAQTYLTCEYARRRVHLRFLANVQTVGGSVFRHEIQVPPDLQIEALAVTAGRAPRRARWSLDETGRLTIFLASPVSGDHVVSFDGTLASPDAGELPLPVVRLTGADLRSAEVNVLRDPQVQVTVTPEQGLRAIEKAVGVGVQSESRVVASYEAVDAAYQARASIAPNHPEIKATTTTVVGRQSDGWHVAWGATYDVTRGSLDRIHVWIPKEVEEPLEVRPPAELSIATVAGEQRKLLTIVPSASIVGSYALELRAQVSVRAARRLVVPDIEAIDARVQERYVVLPSRADDKSVAWQTRGLARAEMPSDRITEIWKLAGPVPLPHRVLADDFEAAWQITFDAGTPQVRIADYSITLLPAGNFQGLATFDLDPSERRHLPLTVPEGCEVLQTWVERIPGCVLPDGPNRYRVLLHTAQLPQRVEVLFRGRSQAKGLWSREVTLAAPSLGDLPIERTLWHVDAACASAQPTRVRGQNLGSVAFELVRAGSLAGVVETLYDALPERLEADQIDAAAGWLERLRLTLDRASDAAEKASADDREDIASQLDVVRQAVDRLSSRLPSDIAVVGQAMRTDPASVPAGSWATTRTSIDEVATSSVNLTWRAPNSPVRAVFQGRQPRLDIRIERLPMDEWLQSTVLAALAVLLIAVGLTSRIGVMAGSWLLARPAAVGAVVGLVWAICLSGPWIGVALVAVCLALWLGEGLGLWRRGQDSANEPGSEKRPSAELA
jgi:hypothetical protein